MLDLIREFWEIPKSYEDGVICYGVVYSNSYVSDGEHITRLMTTAIEDHPQLTLSDVVVVKLKKAPNKGIMAVIFSVDICNSAYTRRFTPVQ